MYTVLARTLTRIFPERIGGAALERPTWRVASELGDRSGIAAMKVQHEVKVWFPDNIKTPRRCHVLITRQSAVPLLPEGYHTPGPMNTSYL